MFKGNKVKKIVAKVGVLWLFGLTSVHAAISDDGIAAAGVSAGTGMGDMFFSIYDASNSTALVLDLNLKVADFLANPAAPFSVINPAVANFIANGDVTSMQWNVAGVSNGPLPDITSIFLLSTVDPDTTPTPFANASVQQDALNSVGAYLQSVNNNLIGDVAETAASTTWLGGDWADSVGGNAFGYNTASDFESGAFESLAMFRVGLNSDGSASELQSVPGLELVVWNLDAGTGELSVSAVPIPGAVWLFGSALAGLVGYRRRG